MNTFRVTMKCKILVSAIDTHVSAAPTSAHCYMAGDLARQFCRARGGTNAQRGTKVKKLEQLMHIIKQDNSEKSEWPKTSHV